MGGSGGRVRGRFFAVPCLVLNEQIFINTRKSVLKTVNGTRRLKVRVSGDEIVKRAVVLKGQMIYD